MYSLQGVHIAPGNGSSRSFEVSGDDRESLLVAFLTELLFLAETEGLAFTQFDLSVHESTRLQATVAGGRIESQDKEIKAVTYHNLEIREDDHGLEVDLVFDV